MQLFWLSQIGINASRFESGCWAEGNLTKGIREETIRVSIYAIVILVGVIGLCIIGPILMHDYYVKELNVEMVKAELKASGGCKNGK
jgi:hypothetical protein